MLSLEKKLKISKIIALLLLCLLLISVAIMQFFSPKNYIVLVKKYSNKYSVSSALVLAIIRVESNFNEKAKSNKEACGLMQITPSTFEYSYKLSNETKIVDIFNAEDNIMLGTNYFSYLLDKFKYESVAICAYNAGEGNVFGWLNNPLYSVDGKTLEKVPFSETESYLKKVFFYKNLYEKVYNLN